MADLQFIRMHHGRKSFKKANRRLSRTDIRQEVNFFVVLKLIIKR